LLGDSAGGNLATVICRKLIELNVVRPKLNILIYPILQFFDFTLPSYVENMPKRILGEIDSENFVNFIQYFTGYTVDRTILLNGHTSNDDKDGFLANYVNCNLLPMNCPLFKKPLQLNSTLNEGIKSVLLNRDVSPLLVDDLILKDTSAENTFVLTVGLDILRDDSLILVERLRRVGASVHHEHYENLFHGVFGLINGPLEFRAAHKIMECLCNYVKSIIF
jgi:acetyl esterase/lipase